MECGFLIHLVIFKNEQRINKDRATNTLMLLAYV